MDWLDEISEPTSAQGGAAFGVFPQMRARRSVQDPEAAKDVPVALARGAVAGAAGLPGDIEQVGRAGLRFMGADVGENTTLPTTKDVEKRLPFRSASETPVGRAATTLGEVAGGVYTGPGAPIRAVAAVPGALRHGAQEFAKAAGSDVSRAIPEASKAKLLFERAFAKAKSEIMAERTAGDEAKYLRDVKKVEPPTENEILDRVRKNNPEVLPIEPAKSAGEVYYNAGQAISGDVRPGTFFNQDRAAVEKFGKSFGHGSVNEMRLEPKKTASEKDVEEAAKALGIYDEGVPVGQYLEQGPDAPYGEDAEVILKMLKRQGYDTVRVNDGISKTPSMVVVDPKVAIVGGAASAAGGAAMAGEKKDNPGPAGDTSWLDAVSTPTGDEYDVSEYAAPEGEGTLARMKRLSRAVYGKKPEDTGVATSLGRTAVGMGEAGLQALTSAVATSAAGLAGLARAGYGAATGEKEPLRRAKETIESVQQARTYSPRTASGQLISEMMAAPMTLASEYGGKAAAPVGGAVGQAVGGERGRVYGEAAGQAVGELAPQVAGTLVGGRQMLQAARTPTTPPTPGPVAGQDYSLLRNMTDEQRARFEQQRRVGVEPTLGSVFRAPEQVRFEEQTAKTPAGAALRQREVETNAALIKAVEDTDKLRTGRRTTENEREVGRSVARALEAKAQESLSNVSELYRAARDSGETKQLVSLQPLQKWLNDHKAEAISTPEINSVQAKLNALKDAEGKRVSIDSLEEIYKAAGQLGRPGEASGKFMRDVKGVINRMTEGAGGDLYREARAARLKHAFEFEDRGAIANLIEKKPGSRTDYKTANEDVFRRAVVNSSLTELQDVTNSLLSVDPKKHPEAVQAVRELQAQTIDHLVEAATKGIATDEQGRPTFSPAAYRNAVRGIGRDKLTHLLGKEAVARLDDVLNAARDVKTAPGRVSGSDTALNLKMEASRFAKQEAAKHLYESVPLVGKALRAGAEYLGRRKEAAALAGQVEEALTPTRAAPGVTAAEAAKEKAANLAARRQYRLSEAGRLGAAVAPAAAVTQKKAVEEENN